MSRPDLRIDTSQAIAIQDGVEFTSPLGHRLMFMALAGLSYLLFAPTILLPVLKESADLKAEESLLIKQNGDLQHEIIRENELRKAFASDRTINERLAVLDLHFHNPNEEVFPVLSKRAAKMSSLPPASSMDRQRPLVPRRWPLPIRQFERWAHQNGLVALFLDPTLRPAILLMSGGLIIAGFVLFAPRRQQRSTSQRCSNQTEHTNPLASSHGPLCHETVVSSTPQNPGASTSWHPGSIGVPPVV